MVLAVLSTQFQTSDGTVNTFLDSLSDAMQLAGFSEVSSTVITDNVGSRRVWKKQLTEADVAYPDIVLALVHTGQSGTSTLSYQYEYQSYSGWDESSESGTDLKSYGTSSFSVVAQRTSGVTFTYYICKHPELSAVHIYSNTTYSAFVGYYRPGIVPSGWSQNVSPFAFVSPQTALSGGAEVIKGVSSLSPLPDDFRLAGIENNGNSSALNNHANVNSYLNLIHVVHSSHNFQAITRFSTDIISTSGSNLSWFHKVQVIPGVEEYSQFCRIIGSRYPTIAVRTI